jgi:hypothetical protein
MGHTAHSSRGLLTEQVEQPAVVPAGLDGGDGVAAAVDALGDERQVVGFAFDGDAAEAFEDAGFDGGAAAGEGLEDGAAGWGDEPDEPAHEVEGLDGGVAMPSMRTRSVASALAV